MIRPSKRSRRRPAHMPCHEAPARYLHGAADWPDGSKGRGSHHVHDPHARQTQSAPRSHLVGSGWLRQTGKSPSSPAPRPHIRMPRILLAPCLPPPLIASRGPSQPAIRNPPAGSLPRGWASNFGWQIADGRADREEGSVAVSGADSRAECRIERRAHEQFAKSRLPHRVCRRMGDQGGQERGSRHASTSGDQQHLASGRWCWSG